MALTEEKANAWRDGSDPRYRDAEELLFRRRFFNEAELEDLPPQLESFVIERDKGVVVKAAYLLLRRSPSELAEYLGATLESFVAAYENECLNEAFTRSFPPDNPNFKQMADFINEDRKELGLGDFDFDAYHKHQMDIMTHRALECRVFIMSRCRDVASWILGLNPGLRIATVDNGRLSLACHLLVEHPSRTFSGFDEGLKQRAREAQRTIKDAVYLLKSASFVGEAVNEDRLPEKHPNISLEKASEIAPHPDAAPKGAGPEEDGSKRARYIFRQEGEVWRLVFGHETGFLNDVQGLHFISRLLCAPNKDLPVAKVENPNLTESQLAMSLDRGESALDGEARRQYSEKLDILNAELGKADLEDEMRDDLLDQKLKIKTALSKATGSHGKGRRIGDRGKNLKDRVRNNINAALINIESTRKLPELYRHLKNSIKFGGYCTYKPDVNYPWEL